MQAAPATASKPEFVPRLRLRSETILVDQGEGFADDFQPVETAVIDLAFDYGGTIVPAGADDVAFRVKRDAGSEENVRRILEGFGPVDLSCLEDCAVVPGRGADYAVHLEGNPEVLCSFSAHALPRLRAMGWQIDVDEDYPCRLVEGAQWYADVAGDPEDGEERDWFELELGVEVDGERVDLLPVLVELIESRGLDALLASSRNQVAIPLGKRRFLAVPPQRIRSIAAVLAELYAVEGMSANGKLQVPKMISSYFDELDDAFGDDAEIHWSGERRSSSPTLSTREPPPKVDAPRGLRATLRSYQEDGLAFLQHLRAHGVGGILADDMGLGKTLQTIAHIVKEKEEGRLDNPVLIVAPTSLVGNWQRELEKFAPSLQVMAHHGPRRSRGQRNIPHSDVVITTYGLLARDTAVFEDLEFYLLVLDEAQTIKNARSLAHRTVREVNAEYRLCLSGTPVENNLEELWALLDFSAPGVLGDLPRFRSAFRIPIERNGNQERLEVLRKRVAPYILRRLKDEVATELPPKTEIVRPIDLRGDQRDLYESIRIAAHATVRKAVKKKGVAASTIDILGALMKLRQACCDPRLVPVRAAREIKNSAKFEALLEMLGPMLDQGRRILIFSQFTSMLALISEELESRKVPFVSITGSTTNRQEAVDAFQAGHAKVFLISLKAGGTGLNLTAADTVIHYDPWWNPAAQAQATDRAYRIGQRNPVFVYNFIVAGSVEERMLNLQRRKQALAEGLFSTQDTGQLEFSSEEVDDLFAPLETA